MNRAALTLIVALILGVLTAYTVGTSSPADAFVPGGPKPKHFDPVSAQEKKIFDEIIKRSYDSDPAKSGKARQILTRQMTRAAPRVISPMLARTGLAGAAAGVWTVVGLELYYLPCWECGTQSVYLNPEISVSSDAVAGNTRNTTTGTPINTQALVSHYSFNRKSDMTWSSSLTAVFAPVNADHKLFSDGTESYTLKPPKITLPGTSLNANPIVSRATRPAPLPTINRVQSSSGSGSGTYAIDLGISVHPQGSTLTAKTTNLCAPSVACSVGAAPPLLDTGSWAGTSSTGEPLKTNSTEGNSFINNVVADPETAPLVDPMDVPEPAIDPNWDPEKDPFNPLFDPFAEPEGDPDGDGIPNRLDPDPEGDGDPDGDGDPNEHPLIAPNPDPAEDPEGDGDPDGDGDPNETTPSPAPAPLPNSDPDADPDQDGQPNRSDPDQDGDGIPNEDDPDPFAPTAPADLPREHPYADPDEDGIPNKDDPDPDGDGIPAEDDPDPFTPTAPGDLPRFHPYADPDQDGQPNRKDQDDDDDSYEDWEDQRPWEPSVPSDPDRDTDGDGVPDPSDPWPGNPHAPADPARDDDQDGVPDYKDPDPDIVWIPWGVPDTTDVPDRKDQPDDDPDVPGTPSTPPWGPEITPETPGTPFVPRVPSNPASPPYAPTTQNPPDRSTGISNPPPTRTDVPDDPTTIDTPDVPPGSPGDPPPTEPPDEGGGNCPVVEPPSFDVPKLQIEGLFPFSLVLWVVGNVQVLAAANSSVPCLDIPVVGQWCFDSPGINTVINTMYGLLWFFGGTFQVLGFYVLIKGGRGTE